MLKAQNFSANPSSDEKNIVEFKNHQQANQKRSFFTQVPNIIDDLGLSPNEVRLYLHMARLAGANYKPVDRSTRELANHCRMSIGAVHNAKMALYNSGLIDLVEYNSENGPAHKIIVIDIWERNSDKYNTKFNTPNYSYQKPVEAQFKTAIDLPKPADQDRDQTDLRSDQSDLLSQILHILQRLLNSQGMDLSVHEQSRGVHEQPKDVHEGVHGSVHESKKSVNSLKEHVLNNNLNNLKTHMISHVEHTGQHQQQSRDVGVDLTQTKADDFSTKKPVSSQLMSNSKNIKPFAINQRFQKDSATDTESKNLPNPSKTPANAAQNATYKNVKVSQPVNKIPETPQEFFVPVDEEFQKLFMAVSDMQQHCEWINWIYKNGFSVEDTILCINIVFDELADPAGWRDGRVTMKSIADYLPTVKIRNKKPFCPIKNEATSTAKPEKNNINSDEDLQHEELNQLQIAWQKEAIGNERFRALPVKEQEILIHAKLQSLYTTNDDFKVKFAKFTAGQKRDHAITLVERDLAEKS